jgi:hypothetical protein
MLPMFRACVPVDVFSSQPPHHVRVLTLVCRCQFAGNPKLRTKYHAVHGEGNLACTWFEQLWLPVTVPTMTSTIQLAVGCAPVTALSLSCAHDNIMCMLGRWHRQGVAAIACACAHLLSRSSGTTTRPPLTTAWAPCS